MQRGALLLAAGGALSPSFAPVTLSVTCPCEPAANNTPPAKAGAELHHGRPLAGRPRGGIARCSLRRKICLPPCKFDSMFKSRLQIAPEALVIAALSGNAPRADPTVADR